MPNHRPQDSREKPYRAVLNLRNVRYSLGTFKTWEQARIQEIDMNILLLEEEREELKRALQVSTESNTLREQLDSFDIALRTVIKSRFDQLRDSLKDNDEANRT